MAVKKIITSTIPNKYVKHYFQLEATAPLLITITDLSRTAFFEESAISVSKYKDALTVRTETTWVSREACDQNDALLRASHPDYDSTRDAYHAANGIIWTVEYQDV